VAPTGSAFSILGVVPTTGADGQVVTLVNTTTQVMTIRNNASGTAAQSIKTLTGADIVSVAGGSSVTLQYNKGELRWYVTGSQNFTVTSGSITTSDIEPGTNSAITVVNGGGKAVGIGDVVLDVTTNALNQKGIVSGPTGGDVDEVWGTDAGGNPGWTKIGNAKLTNSSVTVNTGTGLSGGGNVALGGTLNLTNTAPDQTVVLNNGSGISATGTYPNFTIANTGDLSNTNEGSLTVGVGTASTSLINSNTSGSTPVTLQAGSNISLTESGNTITIASTNPGGTVTNVATGSGLTGGPITGTGTISVATGGITSTHIADGTIAAADLANTGVGAGTYNSVTVNTQGQVTAGINRTITGTTNQVDVTNGNFAANPNVGISPTYTADLAAKTNMTGGGTVVWTGSNLSWTSRFIVISNGRGTYFAASGYFDMSMPADGTVIPGLGGASNHTVTGGVITIPAWQALYYILPIGSGNGSVAANYRIVSYTADFVVPENWILVALRNGDDQTLRLGTGETLTAGQTNGVAGGDYIHNTTTQQATSNFNISGAGVVGTTLTTGTSATIGTSLSTGSSVNIGNGVLNAGGDHIEIMSGVRADDNSYEWTGWYSGTTRQGIILYDGAWSGANNLTNEFSLTAEGNNLLTLNSSNNHIALMPRGGNTGIGILAPLEKLHVNGNAKADNLIAHYGIMTGEMETVTGLGTGADNQWHTIQLSAGYAATGLSIYCSSSYMDGDSKISGSQLSGILSGTTGWYYGNAVASSINASAGATCDNCTHSCNCPNNYVATGWQVYANGQLDYYMKLRCTALNSGYVTVETGLGVESTLNFPDSNADNFRHSGNCPAGTYLKGITIYADDYLDTNLKAYCTGIRRQ
jgi:hypothetical protein